MLVGQKLLVGGHPVAEDHVKERSELELVEDIVGEALIVHGGHDVSVEEHDLLSDVKHEEGEHGNWEQDGHTETVHHSDEHDGQDGRVLVMHEVLGTSVGGNVALDRGALGVSTASASAIDASEQDTEGPVHEDFDDGVVDVENHGSDNDITN